MKLNILIAEPRDIPRTGLRMIFVADERVANIYEAASKEELYSHLHTSSIDLVIANQLLITDITTLPRGRFVLLTRELDVKVFQTACKHQARGYLLESAPADLLRATLYLTEGACLLEPTWTVQIIEYLQGDARFLIREELLTPREREIIRLLREGIDRRTIAKRLNISEATLKTHIKNISRKREDISL